MLCRIRRSARNTARIRPLLEMLDLILMLLVEDEAGATAVEYSLIAVFISIAAIVSMKALGVELAELFTDVSSVLEWGLNRAGL